ncbi:MAG TPA: hypothetical protein VFT06_10325 [Flavisolibacter sp.]|nr:hypothetical protein [Flavisolibacter sp.]
MIDNYYSATIPTLPAQFRPGKGYECESQAAAVQATEAAVCAFYCLSPEELNSNGRQDVLVIARHIVRYLLHTEEGIGIRAIARLTGGDPSNTRKSIHLIEGYIDRQTRVKGEIQTIKQWLNA